MPGIELVNPGLLGLHHIFLERGRDRQTNTCRDFDRQTAKQRNAIDKHNLRVVNLRGSLFCLFLSGTGFTVSLLMCRLMSQLQGM